MSTIKEKISELIIAKNELENKLENEINSLIKTVIPDYNLWLHVVGEWDCEESPIGLCLYNRIEDPCLDNCLYCGNPDERK